MAFQFTPTQIPNDVNGSDWISWKWQSKNSISNFKSFQKYFDMSEDEAKGFQLIQHQFKIRVTPYYASLAGRENLNSPVRKILMPQGIEDQVFGQQMLDPLGEVEHCPVARIIHRYPDRVLFLVTDFCNVYCRYCTRKHFTGKDQVFPKLDEYNEALKYIRMNPGIKEVILSGGDPLTLSDVQLNKVLSDLRAIDHVEIIRIGTRMPVVNPMRITDSLIELMKKYHPIFVMTHFNHPTELSFEASQSLLKFVDNGFPVFNQLVLLNGINNHPAIIQALSRRLLYLRVKPYYMFQCDPSKGTEHFRTSLENSLQIQRELWGRISGLAMPNLSMDIPGGGGKLGFVPRFDSEEQVGSFVGWDGIQNSYQSSVQVVDPFVEEIYLQEWNLIKNQSYGCKKSKVKPQVEHTSQQTFSSFDR